MQHDVDEGGRWCDRLTIARHLINARRDLCPKLRNDLIIDADPPLEDQLLGAPARAQLGSGEISLQSLLASIGRLTPPSRFDRLSRLTPPLLSLPD